MTASIIYESSAFQYYILLAGYPASLGTLPLPPPSLPFVPPFCPSSLGLPGFGQNIWSVIAQNNSIPEIHLKKNDVFFSAFHAISRLLFFLPPTIPTATPLWWGGQFV